MRTRLILFILCALVLLFIAPQKAAAQSPTQLCGFSSGSASPIGSQTCNAGACPAVNTLVFFALNGYQYTSGSVSDHDGNTYSSATSAHVGTSAGYQNYFFYTVVTVSSSCNPYTGTYTGNAAFTDAEIYKWTGNATSGVLDGATGNTFTTNASTQTTTGTVTASGNDLLVSQIVCNSGSSTEFSPGPTGWTSIPGSTVTSWHIAYKIVTPGTYSVTWPGSTGCSYGGGVYGTISLVAFKPASTASTGQIGGFFVGPMKAHPFDGTFLKLPYRQPFDRSRRILDLERM